jgi:hypothetical protein
VDVPLSEPRYDARFSGPDARHGSIVDKIREFRATLADQSRPVEDRRFALRILVRQVGDLHQPLHVGDNHDRGGIDSQVRFFTRGSNLHRVWDSEIIERAGRDEELWLAELVKLDKTDALIKPGRELGDEYQAENSPVVRLSSGGCTRRGVRLAMVLNSAFSADDRVRLKQLVLDIERQFASHVIRVGGAEMFPQPAWESSHAK